MPTRRTLAEAISIEDHALGRFDWAVSLVEYGDYQCAFTRRSWPRVHALQHELTGQLLFVFRHFPREAIHPNARLASAAAEAASAQGEFWTMHDQLFQRQRDLRIGNFRQYARNLGLDPARFERDRASVEIAARIDRDLISGERSGVIRTPTFFINSVRFEGPHTLESLRAAVTAARHDRPSC
jgi:protein-disulfide isomerase